MLVALGQFPHSCPGTGCAICRWTHEHDVNEDPRTWHDPKLCAICRATPPLRAHDLHESEAR